MYKNKLVSAIVFFAMFSFVFVEKAPAPPGPPGPPHAVPETINYQGHLADSGGTPVHGAVDMVFNIYGSSVEGTSLWSEAQTVQVNNGIYAVVLGALNPVSAEVIDGPLWLGVQVGTDPEMTPRQQLHSVPFAMRSAVTEDPVLIALQKKERGDFTYFINHGDGTVTDPSTALMWLDTPFPGYNWYQASGTYDATYNPASVDVCGGLDFAGYTDWRLPNVNDVMSLTAERGQVFDPSQAPGFPLLNYVDGSGNGVLWLGAQYQGYTYSFSLSNFTVYDGAGSPETDTSVHTTCVRLSGF